MGLGWVIDDVTYHDYVAAASGNSNNVAEYLALIRLLEAALTFSDPADLRISGDSQLVINQLCGEWRVAAGHIAALHATAAGLISKLTTAGWVITLRWVERNRNTRADAASNSALIEHGVELPQREPDLGYTPRFREMANALNISPIGFGRVLLALQLRDAEGKPTAKALSEGLAKTRFDGRGIVFDWHQDKVATTVAVFLGDDRRASEIKVKRLQPKREPIRTQHLCGHEVAVGLRPSKRTLVQVAESLCSDCLRGDKVRFAAEREAALDLCAKGDTLVDAVELIVDNPRLRPSVFLASWGKWSHDRRQSVLDRYRGVCDKPGLHPEVQAAFAELESLKNHELDRLIRAALAA